MKTLLGRAALVVGGALLVSSAALADVRVTGAGATFPEPLYKRWVAEFEAVPAGKGVKIDYSGVGSGGGIKAITDKTVAFAGSDAPLSKAEIEKLGGDSKVVQVPSCAGGVVPAYNVPELKGDLNFTGDVLAKIFQGKISKWNDPAIAALNPDEKLPDLVITPAYRTDGSGTTYVWTNYLATQSDDFKSTIGAGKQVQWPTGQGGKGNPGVAAVIQQTKGALGYIEANFATQNKIAFGKVKNAAGKFVKASPETVAAAGEAAVNQLTGQVMAANIWNQAGEKAYPAASFTYLIVYKDMDSVKGEDEAKATYAFLNWAVTGGQTLASEMDYAPLAPAVQAKVTAVLKGLTFKGQSLSK